MTTTPPTPQDWDRVMALANEMAELARESAEWYAANPQYKDIQP